MSATSRAVSAVACAQSMSTSFSSNAASCSAGSPGGMRGSASVVASRHIWVAITRRLRSSIWSTAAQATPGARDGRRAAAAAAAGRAALPVVPLPRRTSRWRWSPQHEPVQPTAPTRSPVRTLSADPNARRAQHVQVHERAARLAAPDRDVVAAPAVVAGLDDPAVAHRHERGAGRSEHVLPLVHVPAAPGAEASVLLAEFHPPADREHQRRQRGVPEALEGRQPARLLERRGKRGELVRRGRRGGNARSDGRHCRGRKGQAAGYQRSHRSRRA